MARVYQTLSIECPSSIFFWHVSFVIVPFLLSFLFCFVMFFVFDLFAFAVVVVAYRATSGRLA